MRSLGKLIGSLLIGAGTMYLLDPDRGNRRRALVRDKGVRVSRKLGEGVATATRDIRNRTTGVAAELKGRFRQDLAGDEVIEERIRAELGRTVSHPGAVSVTVFDGRVILSGEILSAELDVLLAAVRGVRGVSEVENQLNVHPDASGVPALQGGRPRERRPELLQDNWAPATRVLVGGLAGSAVIAGLRRGGAFGAALAALGTGLLARTAVNQPVERLGHLVYARAGERPEGVEPARGATAGAATAGDVPDLRLDDEL